MNSYIINQLKAEYYELRNASSVLEILKKLGNYFLFALIVIVILGMLFVVNFIDDKNWLYLLAIMPITGLLMLISLVFELKGLFKSDLSREKKFLTTIAYVGLAALFLTMGVNAIRDLTSGPQIYSGQCQLTKHQLYRSIEKYEVVLIDLEDMPVISIRQNVYDELKGDVLLREANQYMCNSEIVFLYLPYTGLGLNLESK